MSKRYLSAAARALVALSFCTVAATAGAQDYPTRPVRIVVAFPAGGGNDIIARFFSARLTPRLGQQIVIDNRGGASGIIGTEIVARAVPDGYTLLFTSLTHSMNEAITKLPYDTLKSFTPVSMLGRGTNVLVVNPALPVRTL
ncbi:MAG TPA: tripartite tricarboxylate transporter substrate-binding protein, partial [Burkholderiales bacterium]|nr:tripartite tricarboxylate transporter substrate-binding protein [Burkholderiales bacterium]